MLLILLDNDTQTLLSSFCTDLSAPQTGADVTPGGVNGVTQPTAVNGAIVATGLSAMETNDDC
jgi:hypothetical protein